jgi:NFU1 iron-sulfur cluster scaffold homolog, mitochondrial
MSSLRSSRLAAGLLRSRRRPARVPLSIQQSTRQLSTRLSHPILSNPARPDCRQLPRANALTLSAPGRGARSIFIQTENTPNPDALKFLPNHRVLPPDVTTPFIEYLNPRSTIAPPYPSPLAAQLMNIDGVTSVFYGADFITVIKAADANWVHIRPEIFALITEAVTTGQTIVNVAERKPGEDGQETAEEDSLAYNENDSEVVGMIKELLETRIRPAIQEDGGDIEYRSFENGYVALKLRGACRTCDSSTVTLKNGIEGMLMHYVCVLAKHFTSHVLTPLQIEEVKGVHQVLDQEEEIAMAEFARFEEKLKTKRDQSQPPAQGEATAA